MKILLIEKMVHWSRVRKNYKDIMTIVENIPRGSVVSYTMEVKHMDQLAEAVRLVKNKGYNFQVKFVAGDMIALYRKSKGYENYE